MLQHYRPVYILLAGLCASGKTTHRKAISGCWQHGTLVQLSTDDVVDIAASSVGKTYSEVFKDNIKPATWVVGKRRTHALEDGLSIIHDQTNTSATKRHDTMCDVPADYFKVCIVLSAREDIRQQRLLARPGKVIPPEVDENMRRMWSYPDLREGFDAVIPSYLTSKVLRPWLV
jgi:hypothetical protein